MEIYLEKIRDLLARMQLSLYKHLTANLNVYFSSKRQSPGPRGEI